MNPFTPILLAKLGSDLDSIPVVDSEFAFLAARLLRISAAGFGTAILLLSLAYAFYFLQTLPWRRRERAAILMDLMESGVSAGGPLEQHLIAASATRDRLLPVRAHLLAAHLESGITFAEALARTPRLLPPPVQRLFELGSRHGILARLLPACRTALNEPPQSGWIVAQQVALSLLLAALQCAAILGLLRIAVLPKFRQILADLSGGTSPLNETLISAAGWISAANFAVCGLLALWMFARIGGPRVFGMSLLRNSRMFDSLVRIVPWRRTRMRRDFAAALASLLDAGVPEREALIEAGQIPGSPWYRDGTARALHCLAHGVSLTNAVREVDDAGELRWRLANARHGRTGFRASLQGWLDGLDTRAHAQEFAAAQGLFTFGLLVQGLAVGLAVAGFFGALIHIIDATLLW
ncbi:MAG: type II secretion system F family protein [Verrucomicrobiales bacterium]|nr:type II secretion system F family protein [Verrucomicrobiales bacterium]